MYPLSSTSFSKAKPLIFLVALLVLLFYIINSNQKAKRFSALLDSDTVVGADSVGTGDNNNGSGDAGSGSGDGSGTGSGCGSGSE